MSEHEPDELKAERLFSIFFNEEKKTKLKEHMSANFRSKFDEEESITEIERVVENERKFLKQVIEKYVTWSKEKDVVVLWDIDETMGVFDIHLGVEDAHWRFRPFLIELFQFLKQHFSEISNGILSNRTATKDQLQEGKSLSPLREFLDEGEIYSSRHVVIVEDEDPDKPTQAVIESKKLATDLKVRCTPDLMQKYTVWRELKDKGKQVKLIDDGGISRILGKDGLYVGDIMPKSDYL